MPFHDEWFDDNPLVEEELTVDTDKMREFADNINKQVMSLNETVDALRAHMDELDNVWVGEAANQYREYFEDVYALAKEAVNTFKRFPSYIYEQAWHFDDADKKAMGEAEYAQMMVERLADGFLST